MNSLNAAKHRAINFIRRSPILFFPLMRSYKWLRRIRGLPLVTRETELVIEGFFRSANTFAVYAFLSAQSRKIVVANHTHAPATIQRAAHLQVPTLILIREPQEAIVSLVLKHSALSPEQSFRDYIDYYQQIWPYHERYVVATFKEVTTDFGQVIARVNQRYGTHFALFEHSSENAQKVWAKIEGIDRRVEKNNVLKFSVPTDERKKAKAKAIAQLQTKVPELLVGDARKIYLQFTERADSWLCDE